MKFKYIEWLDACGRSGWSEGGSLRPLPIISCGVVAEETKEYITLASSRHADEEENVCDGLICIPKNYITKTRNIKL